MYCGTINYNREMASGHFLMSVKVPEGFETPLPGQFVMIRCRDRLDPLLGRPLSVYAFERQRREGSFEVLYRVVGKGTRHLSRLREGEDVDVLGPLGTGFHTPNAVDHVVLIAGGMGVAPITYLASHYRRQVSSLLKITCYLGAKTSDGIIGLERLQDLCTKVVITTDDGSMGTCGVVTDLISADLKEFQCRDTLLYACGPHGMMKCLAEGLAGRDILCQVSLEERMACGVGACLGCTVALRNRMGGQHYGRVCKDGPVFNIHRVDWDG